jgi:sigma-B regulation protein RsbU (phosphoserine phosphatase)
MASRRLADPPTPARRRQAQPSLPMPPDDSGRTARDLLLNSWPGRLFIIAAGLKVLVALIRQVGDVPDFLRVLSTAATVALAFSVLFFLTRLVFLVQRRLLWRVRRKLILSYIFIGVVPSLLILGFFLLGTSFMAGTVAAHLFRNGYDDISRNAQLLAEAAAAEIGRSPRTAVETVDRVQRNGALSLKYPALSMAFVPAAPDGPEAVSRGPWEHLRGLSAAGPIVPDWVRQQRDGWTGTIAVVPPDAPNEPELVVRTIRAARRTASALGWVVVDVPLDDAMLARLYERTGVKVSGPIAIAKTDERSGQVVGSPQSSVSSGQLFGRTVSTFDVADWPAQTPKRAMVALSFGMSELYGRLISTQTMEYESGRLGDMLKLGLVAVGVLFLIIELVALVMGLALARSITSSIHELFMGTERVRQGDFTHRITTNTKDQLGELAGSFNQMTGSIENLLQTAAEKKRLEEELRIARQIQMSLLPRGQLDMPGLGVTALCVPAREVGGDYYDFFPLGPGRLGVLIADVAGKGTSAALYMAELKGLVMAMSQIYQSPRQLMIEANRILSENLDSRSFITMTYAVIDLVNGVMTYARAGHTPLIYLPGPSAPLQGAQVLVPSGMVLGLRIDGAVTKFNDLLEEVQIPLHRGDVLVFYTDGITEAMNADSDLFGDSRLSRIVEEHGHLESGELRERILREIEAFVGTADQHDDMTMILIKITQAVAEEVAV